MSWQEIVKEYFVVPGSNSSIKLYPPASEQDLLLAERELEVAFPQDLKDLLAETNGVSQRLFLKVAPYDVVIGDLIWPLQRIIAENIDVRTDSIFREIYGPLNDLIFFSDAGNGDLFGFGISNHRAIGNKIFRWDHEDDGRNCIAHSLKEFLHLISR